MKRGEELEEARRHLIGALKGFVSLKCVEGEAATQSALGSLFWKQDNIDQATHRYKQALSLFGRIESVRPQIELTQRLMNVLKKRPASAPEIQRLDVDHRRLVGLLNRERDRTKKTVAVAGTARALDVVEALVPSVRVPHGNV